MADGLDLLKRVLLLTGNPSVGKTTVLLKVIEFLKKKGYSVGGMISREVRFEGVRVGFEILDLNSDKHGWLAHVNQKFGPQVGKYRVNLHDLNNVGVNAILNAVKENDIVAIDEIGPMELFSEKFKQAVWEAIESGKFVIGVVHLKAKDKLIERIKARENTEIFTVTYENRDTMPETVVKKLKNI